MSKHPELPFDILEGVIDTLAADDTPTFTHLKSFSLTCKSLLHSCRKHIFKTIIVGLPVPMDDINEDDADDNRSSSDAKRTEIPPERLCWLISVQPQLSEYVRVLKLGIAREHDQSLDIAQVLRCFRRLQSLTLDTEHDFGPEYMTKWSRIPHELQQSLLFLIERETLTALTLRSHCKFPLFQAKLSVNLHCLHIENLTIFEEGDGAVSLSHHVEPIFLRRYSIGYSGARATTAILGARLADGRHIFDFSELRHLRAEICYFPEAALDLAAAHDVIRRTTQLRTLSLKISMSHMPLGTLFGGLAVASLNTLKRITIHRSCPLGWPITPLSGLSAGFEAICDFPNVLEEVFLTERLYFDDLCRPGRELRKLDAILGSPAWPCLRTVCIKFTTDRDPKSSPGYNDDLDMHDVETSLRHNHFPTLSARETVSFRVNINRNGSFAIV